MAQKYYVASKGSYYLSVTNHPGTLTEQDIVSNLARMMMLEADSEEQNVQARTIREEASRFYQENIERIMEMVKPGEELKEIPQEEAEEYQNLTFSEWEQWEFPQTEWN
nr:MAG TPA: hypothetical protein [Caudoviricetes sp.]